MFWIIKLLSVNHKSNKNSMDEYNGFALFIKMCLSTIVVKCNCYLSPTA